MDVAVLVFNDVFDSGLAAILDVLQCANEMRDNVEQPPPAWRVSTVAFTPQIRTGAGHLVTAGEPGPGPDLLVVPAIAKRRAEDLIAKVSGPDTARERGLIAETREQGTAIASACAGSFLLAESGVLEGLRVTTSWWLAPYFRRRYPSVVVEESQMVTTSDGITTAGAAFGHVDLALAIVRMTSPALADLVARYLVVDSRPSQSAYTIPSALAQSDPTVSAFEKWVRTRLSEPFSIVQAAAELKTSERTLQRAVQRTLGMSPVRFVQELRIEQSTHLLRTTRLPLEEIARKVGYEHPNTLRVLLKERTGATAGSLRRS